MDFDVGFVEEIDFELHSANGSTLGYIGAQDVGLSRRWRSRIVVSAMVQCVRIL